MGRLGVLVLRLARFIPPSHGERDAHAGLAQFIGYDAVDHGAGHDHAADAQSSDALSGGAARVAIVDRAALENADHRLKHGLEGALGGCAATGDVGRKRDHGAGIFDVLEMLLR